MPEPLTSPPLDLDGMRHAAAEDEQHGHHLQAGYLRAGADEIERLREALQAINRRASPDPSRTFDKASTDLYWCACEARRALFNDA